MALNLEKQLRFYGAYHHNPVNITIHIIFVPILLFTALLFSTYTRPLIALPEFFQIKHLPLNLGTIGGIVYTVLYLLLEPVAGALLAPLLLAGTAFTNYLTSTYGVTAVYWAASIHIFSWIVQFIGHGVFEGRSPALMDNIIQAVFLAPLFVWLEVLFMLGYRPELKARLDKGVEEDIANFKKRKEAAVK